MQLVDKHALLNALEGTKPGLTQKEVIEQSSSFVFKDGRVYTFNDEVCCSAKTELEIEGSVLGMPLLEILRRLPDDEIKVEVGEGELLIRGRKKEIGVRMEKEIYMPLESVEQTNGKWKTISEDFLDAMDLVRQCAETDKTKGALTCVRMTPECIEAFDNYQMCRWTVNTKLKDEALIKSDTAKAIVKLGINKISATGQWVHFWNQENDIILSSRKYIEDYIDLAPYLAVQGVPASFPKGLVEAIELSELSSADNNQDEKNVVLVEIRPDKLRITGTGVSSRYTETKSIRYKGTSLAFKIHSKILSNIVSRFNDCHISEKFIHVDGGSFVFAARLTKAGG